MSKDHYKNRYHPMIILLYHSKMLSAEETSMIARTTRNNWKHFSHEDYYGYEMVKSYIEDFDYMKDVLTHKHLKRGMKMMCAVSYGYRDLINEIENNKKLVRKHAENITFSIKRLSHYSKMNLSDACRFFGVTKDWFYRHRQNKPCSVSTTGKCFRQYPSQLTIKELLTIEKVIQLPENKGIPMTTLYYDSMRKRLIFCCRSTFSKFAKVFGYKKIKRKKSEEKKVGFKATYPFEWLHVDITDVKTEIDGVQKVAFVKDNFSKALLHKKSIPKSADSHFIRDLLEETFEMFKLLDKSLPINILSDGGSENKGAVIEWVNQIKAPPIVRKITANTLDFPYSNSMSESTHSIYKTEFMKTKHSYDRIEHLKDLDRFMIYYNETRFPTNHYGLTPMEVLDGEIPNKNKFREEIKNARVERLEKNRVFNECPISCIPK